MRGSCIQYINYKPVCVCGGWGGGGCIQYIGYKPVCMGGGGGGGGVAYSTLVQYIRVVLSFSMWCLGVGPRLSFFCLF